MLELLLLKMACTSFRTTNILNTYEQNAQVSAYVLRGVITRKTQVFKKSLEEFSPGSWFLCCFFKKILSHPPLRNGSSSITWIHRFSPRKLSFSLTSSIRPVPSTPDYIVSSTEFLYHWMPSLHISLTLNCGKHPILHPVICSSSASILNASTQGSSPNAHLFSVNIWSS